MNYFYDYYVDIFKSKYIKFDGRSSRSEFWFFALFNLVISSLLFVLDIALGTTYTPEVADTAQSIGYISSVYSIFVLIPSLALTFRRLHDVNKSAWWLFAIFIPLIGFFIILYFYVKAGDEGNNKYGSNPLNLHNNHAQIRKLSNRDKHSQGSTGKKIFKIIGITLLVIFVIAGALLFYMGGALYSIGDNIMQEVNNQVTSQQVTQSGDEIAKMRAELLHGKASAKIFKPIQSKAIQEPKTTSNEDELKALQKELEELKRKRKELILQSEN